MFCNKRNNKTQAQTEFSNGILFPKLFQPTVRKNIYCDPEPLLKFEAEGREFEKKIEITRKNLFKQ